MANILTYLDWRGDLTLDRSPFCEVDNLILSELSYLDFSGIVPPPGEGSLPLAEAAEAFFRRAGRPSGKIDMGVLVPDAIPVLLEKMASAPRFEAMALSGFVSTLDVERSEQFAALSADLGDGSVYLSYRGTDDTIAGWKEDFLIGCMPEVPAQKKAVQYLTEAARLFPRKRLIPGGHSKGGNLAAYAAVFAPAAVQRRISSVWSNDGPGFHSSVLTSPGHQRVEDRIRSIVPKSSVVGMLLEHEEHYSVVDSTQVGLLQHDGFSWEVMGDHFVTLREVSRQGYVNERAMKDWVSALSQPEKEKFVDGLFEVLTASGASTVSELKENGFRSAAAMVRAMKNMEKDTRDALVYAVKLLVRSNLRATLEDFQAQGSEAAARLLAPREQK